MSQNRPLPDRLSAIEHLRGGLPDGRETAEFMEGLLGNVE